MRQLHCVLLSALQPPYIGDLSNLMPTHAIDTSEEAVAFLSLSMPGTAECVRSMKNITDTLVIWEDGTLGEHLVRAGSVGLILNHLTFATHKP